MHLIRYVTQRTAAYEPTFSATDRPQLLRVARLLPVNYEDAIPGGVRAAVGQAPREETAEAN
jgi:hypothetical protein